MQAQKCLNDANRKPNHSLVNAAILWGKHEKKERKKIDSNFSVCKKTINISNMMRETIEILYLFAGIQFVTKIETFNRLLI